MTLKEKVKISIRGYKLLNKLIPSMLPFEGIKAVVTALFPFVNIFMSGKIITALSDGKPLNAVLMLVLITTVSNVLLYLIKALITRYTNYLWTKFWPLLDLPMSEKIMQMDYEYIEDTKVHEKREKIRLMQNSNALGLPRLQFAFAAIIQSLFTIIFSVSLTIGAFVSTANSDMGFWNFIFKPWFAIVMILFLLLNIFCEIYLTSISTKKTMETYNSIQSASRMGGYFYEYFMSYRAGKDLKLYNMGKTAANIWQNVTETFLNSIKKLQYINAGYGSLRAISATFLNAVIYVYVAIKALFGCFGVGSIVQYVGSLMQFSTGFTGLVEQLTLLNMNCEPLAEYFEFLDIPNQKYRGSLSVEKRADNEYEIEFHDVSFKYPNTQNFALRHLNLTLHIGQRMAVVGMNGSGKTTMIKLLCRLYDPTEGSITLNGIDIKLYNYDEYLGIFGVVFQDFKLFSFMLGQNVSSSLDYDKDKAIDALTNAGFKDRLKTMGLDTPLYKDFDENGVEISGGEAQKIALARALYKDAPFIVLDEPTAALDPISEFEMYNHFNQMVKDKTAIYISHRLSSCRFCDDIAVFDKGELVQRGNHDTLIADESGKYNELWNAQAQYYQDNGQDDCEQDDCGQEACRK